MLRCAFPEGVNVGNACAETSLSISSHLASYLIVLNVHVQGGIQWLKLFGDPDAGLSQCHGVSDDEVSTVYLFDLLTSPLLMCNTERDFAQHKSIFSVHGNYVDYY